MLERFNTELDLADWAHTSICSSDFSPALEGIGDGLARIMNNH